MGKPHLIAQRSRVLAFVNEGQGRRVAARHFRVSPKFVKELVKLRRETGSLAGRRQRNVSGHGKLTGWIKARIAAKGDLMVAELAETYGIASIAAPSFVCCVVSLLRTKKTFKRLNRSARLSPISGTITEDIRKSVL